MSQKEKDDALIRACWSENEVEMRNFMVEGHDLNVNDSYPSTIICADAYWGHFKAVRMLLVFGADPNIRNKDGATALDCAYAG